MEALGINILAIGAAALAAFAFGAGYYTLLGKVWLGAVGKTEEEVRGERTATPFVTSFAGLVVMAVVLAMLMPAEGTMVGALHYAALAWLGFFVPCMATNNAFQGQSPKLTALDAGHWLGVVVIQALILRAM